MRLGVVSIQDRLRAKKAKARNRFLLMGAAVVMAVFAVWAIAGGIGGSKCPPIVEPREPVAEGTVEGVMILYDDAKAAGERCASAQPMGAGRILAVPMSDTSLASLLAEWDHPFEAQDRLEAEGIPNRDRPELAELDVPQAFFEDQGRFRLELDAPGKYLLCPLPESSMAASCAKANLFPGNVVVLTWSGGATKVEGSHQP